MQNEPKTPKDEEKYSGYFDKFGGCSLGRLAPYGPEEYFEMGSNILPATDRAAWDALLNQASPPTFLQSWAWGETQRALGEEVIRCSAGEGTAAAGIVQAVTVTARRGRFLHAPHGPVVLGSKEQDTENKETVIALLSALRDEAKGRGLAFLRVSPIQNDTPANRAVFQGLGFRPAPIHLHAERQWILDLSPSEDLLRAGMRKTTRNLVRRAEREGVRVRLVSARGGDFDDFVRLYAETAKRERFVPFPRAFLETEFDAFARENHALLVLAEHAGMLLAGAIIIFTPWSAFYHHGASSRLRPRVPAAYAVQWAAIREAKRRGCTAYNFWGIATARQQTQEPATHRWSGLALFKTGFGGREVPLVPTQDLPLTVHYWLAYAVDSFRRWKRGI